MGIKSQDTGQKPRYWAMMFDTRCTQKKQLSYKEYKILADPCEFIYHNDMIPQDQLYS